MKELFQKGDRHLEDSEPVPVLKQPVRKKELEACPNRSD